MVLIKYDSAIVEESFGCRMAGLLQRGHCCEQAENYLGPSGVQQRFVEPSHLDYCQILGSWYNPILLEVIAENFLGPSGVCDACYFICLLCFHQRFAL